MSSAFTVAWSSPEDVLNSILRAFPGVNLDDVHAAFEEAAKQGALRRYGMLKASHPGLAVVVEMHFVTAAATLAWTLDAIARERSADGLKTENDTLRELEECRVGVVSSEGFIRNVARVCLVDFAANLPDNDPPALVSLMLLRKQQADKLAGFAALQAIFQHPRLTRDAIDNDARWRSFVVAGLKIDRYVIDTPLGDHAQSPRVYLPDLYEPSILLIGQEAAGGRPWEIASAPVVMEAGPWVPLRYTVPD